MARRLRLSPVTIVHEAFRRWENTYRLANDQVEARVVADVGPRVIELRRVGGPNLLYLRAREVGGRGESVWRFRGGWRLWIAPERRATTYALDNDSCEVTLPGPATLRVVGAPQPEASIQKSVTITIDAERPRFTIESRIVNVGTAPVTCAPWTVAVLRPGGRAFLPLDIGPPEELDAIRRVVLWSYTRIDDPRYRIADGLVEIDHRGVAAGPEPTDIAPGRDSDESKVGVDSAAGWAAYLHDGTLLVTHSSVDAGPRVDGGATLEAYSSREFIELEHLGVLETLAPGADACLRETWAVFAGVTLPAATDGAEAIRTALAPYVRQTTDPA